MFKKNDIFQKFSQDEYEIFFRNQNMMKSLPEKYWTRPYFENGYIPHITAFFLLFPRINPRRASRTRNRPDNASSFHGLEFSTIQPKAPFVGVQLLSSHDVYGQAGPPARANQPETHVSTFARPYPRSVGGCERQRIQNHVGQEMLPKILIF